MTISEKYVVFKKEDFDHWRTTENAEVRDLDGDIIHDVFVLRSSDVFAAPTLHAYAGAVATTIDLDATRGFLSDNEKRQYTALADGVTELALEWQRASTRLPT